MTRTIPLIAVLLVGLQSQADEPKRLIDEGRHESQATSHTEYVWAWRNY